MLADVFDEVAQRMTGVTCWLGRENLDRNESPPRMVWIPTEDTYAAAQRYVGGLAQSNPKPAGAKTPRSLRTRVAGVVIHLWAAGADNDTASYKDLRACETLVNRCIWHLGQVAPGGYQINSGRWLEANVGHKGRAYLLDVTLLFPVFPPEADDPVALAPITELSMEGTHVADPIQTPTGDVTGTPAP